MASPAAAGVAALMFAYDPSLSAADVQALLETTATDINERGWDRETGYGEVDAYHALQVLSAADCTRGSFLTAKASSLRCRVPTGH